MNAVRRTDLIRLLGDLDDDQIAEILALNPSVVEVEQAALWAAGQGEELARKGHTLMGVVASIVDIVSDDEDDEPLARPVPDP